LPTDGLTRKKVKPISLGETAQLTKQPIFIGKRKKRNRRWGVATIEQEAIYTKLLVVNAIIGEMTVRVFINLGCQGNYMSPAFFRKTKIPQKIKQNFYGLYTFDNQSMLANKERIDKETGPISVNVGIY
jgi:hypothetical protein